jgi:hypothetical protein
VSLSAGLLMNYVSRRAGPVIALPEPQRPQLELPKWRPFGDVRVDAFVKRQDYVDPRRNADERTLTSADSHPRRPESCTSQVAVYSDGKCSHFAVAFKTCWARQTMWLLPSLAALVLHTCVASHSPSLVDAWQERARRSLKRQSELRVLGSRLLRGPRNRLFLAVEPLFLVRSIYLPLRMTPPDSANGHGFLSFEERMGPHIGPKVRAWNGYEAAATGAEYSPRNLCSARGR